MKLNKILLIFVICISFFNINIVQAHKIAATAGDQIQDSLDGLKDSVQDTMDDVTQKDGVPGIIYGADGFIDAGKDTSETIDTNKLSDVSNIIYNALFLIGMVIAVAMASILGIKFMLGSAEEKADIKDSLVPFIIGCIVVFGAFGIWKIFINIGNSI